MGLRQSPTVKRVCDKSTVDTHYYGVVQVAVGLSGGLRRIWRLGRLATTVVVIPQLGQPALQYHRAALLALFPRGAHQGAAGVDHTLGADWWPALFFSFLMAY